MPQLGIDPVLESMFSLIVIFACFLIYFKTKEIYELSGHKGVKYFRYIFLTFGITHLSRVAVKWIIPQFHPRFIPDLSVFQTIGISFFSMLMIYTSTLMFIYLLLTFLWEKVDNSFVSKAWFIHSVALLVIVLTLFQNRRYMFILFQLISFIGAMFLLTIHNKKVFKKKQNPLIIATYAIIFGHFIIIQLLEMFSMIFPKIGTVIYIAALCFFVVLVDRVYIHFSKSNQSTREFKNAEKRPTRSHPGHTKNNKRQK